MRSNRSMLCTVIPSCAIALSQMMLGVSVHADPPKAGVRPQPARGGNNLHRIVNQPGLPDGQYYQEPTLDGSISVQPVRGQNNIRRVDPRRSLPAGQTRATPTLDGSISVQPVRGQNNIRRVDPRRSLPAGQTRATPTLDGSISVQPVRGQNNQHRIVNRAGLPVGETRATPTLDGRNNVVREGEVIMVRPETTVIRPAATRVVTPVAKPATGVKFPAYHAALDALLATQEAMHNGQADLARTNLTTALNALQKSRDRQEVHATRQDGINAMQAALRQMNQNAGVASLDDTTGRAIQDVQNCLERLNSL